VLQGPDAVIDRPVTDNTQLYARTESVSDLPNTVLVSSPDFSAIIIYE